MCPRPSSSYKADISFSFGQLPLGRSASLAAATADAAVTTLGDVITSDRMIDGEYPTFLAGGEGAYVDDVDANRYLDFLLAYGMVILGRAHPAVDEAVIDELRSGFATGLPTPAQAELTRTLVDITPGAEMALLLKAGSDATSAAVRLARDPLRSWRGGVEPVQNGQVSGLPLAVWSHAREPPRSAGADPVLQAPEST